MGMDTATVLIDSRTLFREGLAYLLCETRYRPIESVASITDLPQNLSFASRTPLFIVSVDPRQATAGSTALREVFALRKLYPHARLIVLSASPDSRYVVATLEAGANGYILDTVTPNTLVQSLDLIMLGGPPTENPKTDRRFN